MEIIQEYNPKLIKEKLLNKISKNYYCTEPNALPEKQLIKLKIAISTSIYLGINNLNSDFVSTKGFSIVFKRSGINQVKKKFPFFSDYLDLVLDPDCNAFYLNPLLLIHNSRVDAHIDRSLRSYLKTIEPPLIVSVLYIQVPENINGGNLIFTHNKKSIGQIKPQVGMLLYFKGNLTHSVNTLKSDSKRLSLVCEQYMLNEDELMYIPELAIESRNIKY